MFWDHALKMQTSHNIYLFMASFKSKYAIYIVETEAIKASKGKGVLLSWLQNIAEATPPVRNQSCTDRCLCGQSSTDCWAASPPPQVWPGGGGGV